MSEKLISLDQFQTMMTGQCAVNEKAIGANWKEREIPFYVAASCELGEALAGLESEWVWWKAIPAKAKGQIWLEIIDAFHFSISEFHDVPVENLCNRLNDGYMASLSSQMLGGEMPTKASAVCNMMAAAFNGDYEEVMAGYGIISNLFGFSPLDIYNWYLAKNALNRIRQDNGYKTGEYLKMWKEGVEDNCFLEEALDKLGEDVEFDALYAELKNTYDVYKSVWEDSGRAWPRI